MHPKGCPCHSCFADAMFNDGPNPMQDPKTAPLDLHAMHTLYSGCTPQEKCELIERIWKLEEDAHNLRSPVHAICNQNLTEALTAAVEQTQRLNEALDALKNLVECWGKPRSGIGKALLRADEILKGRP